MLISPVTCGPLNHGGGRGIQAEYRVKTKNYDTVQFFTQYTAVYNDIYDYNCQLCNSTNQPLNLDCSHKPSKVRTQTNNEQCNVN